MCLPLLCISTDRDMKSENVLGMQEEGERERERERDSVNGQRSATSPVVHQGSNFAEEDCY